MLLVIMTGIPISSLYLGLPHGGTGSTAAPTASSANVPNVVPKEASSLYNALTLNSIPGAPSSASALRGVDSGVSPTASTGGLAYNGGPTIHASITYAIFWLPSGSRFEPSNGNDSSYRGLITNFFKNLGGTPFYNILTQYPDSTNGAPLDISSFGGSYNDTTPYPVSGARTNPLRNVDVQGEVFRDIFLAGWQPGPNKVFFIFTGNGIQTCFDVTDSVCTPNYCAYHSYFPLASENFIYADVPDFFGVSDNCKLPLNYTPPNGDLYGDSAINLISHELFEAVSDPLLNAWYGSSSLSSEIGDLCAWVFGIVGVDGNVVLHGHNYLVQQEWSNFVKGCALSYGPPYSVFISLKPSGVYPSFPEGWFNITYTSEGSRWWTLTTYTNGSVVIGTDQNTELLVRGSLPGSGSQAERCFNQNCADVSFNSGNGIIVTYYYYDLLAQQASVSIVGGGTPSVFLNFTTAPLSTGSADSPQRVTVPLALPVPLVIWVLRGTIVSVTPVIDGGIGERWFPSATSWFVSSPAQLPAPILYYRQYFLTVEGGSAASDGHGWYDAGQSASAASLGEYGRFQGSGVRVVSYNLDGGTSTVLVSSIDTIFVTMIMNSPHSVHFNSVTQYQFSLDSTASSALDSVTSPTIAGDNYWYDPGTHVSVTLNYVWGASGSQRQSLLSYSLDGKTTIPTRKISGTLTVTSIAMNISHGLGAVSTLQYHVSASAVGVSGSQTGDDWFDAGSQFTVQSQYPRAYTANSPYQVYTLSPGFHILSTTNASGILWQGSNHTLTFEGINAEVTIYVPRALNLVPTKVLDNGVPIAFSYDSATGVMSFKGSSIFTVEFSSPRFGIPLRALLAIFAAVVVGGAGAVILILRRIKNRKPGPTNEERT